MADEKAEEKQELAVANPFAGQMMERIAGRGDKPAMTFDPTTREGAIKFLQAKLKELPSLKSQINKTLYITDIFTHDVSRAGSEPGEIEEWQRTVVYDKDGNAYTCGSEGVWDSLCAFMAVRPRFPWSPPIKCEVKIRELPGGKTWMYLDPDLDSILANTKTPKPK